jgi:hypothetical protein
MYGDGYGYWPPFYDPTAPNGTDMPAYILRPVTTILPDGSIGTVDTPTPQCYL